MTPQDIPDLTERESILFEDEEERLFLPEGSIPRPRLLRHPSMEGSESAQEAPGERPDGVGSESCDQETHAWNPRYRSMNYALSRLAGAG